MGILITTETPVFKQGNKISREPPNPMHITELTIINHIQMDMIK